MKAGRRRLATAAMVAATALATTAGTASADVAGPITDRIGAQLDQAGAASTGLYLKEVGGDVLAGRNESLAFEPASTLKVLVALHALQQVQAGDAALDDQVARMSANGSCPYVSPLQETETLETAIQLMMQVSDNRRTHALVMHFGVDAVNATATNLGLTETAFHVREEAPGYDMIGCILEEVAPDRVERNEAALAELSVIYEGVAHGTLLSGTAREDFARLTTGRRMFEAEGYDYLDAWPRLLAMVQDERPEGLSDAAVALFTGRMDEYAKGGGYGVCFDVDCTRLNEWVSVSGYAEFPTCEANAVASRGYVWGVYIDAAPYDAPAAGDEDPPPTPAGAAFGATYVDILREQARSALAGFAECFADAPTVTVEDRTVTYDGSPHLLSATTDPGGLSTSVVHRDASDTVVDAPTAVGTYTATGTLEEEGFTASDTGTLTIEAIPLTVTVGDVSRLFGAPNPPLVPSSIEGLLGDDEVSVTCTSPAGPDSPAGSYPIECAIDGASNYTIEEVVGELVVGYGVGAFEQPVNDPAGADPSVFRSGSTIPVKFQLLGAGGVPIPDALALELAADCRLDVGLEQLPGDPEQVNESPPPLAVTADGCARYEATSDRFVSNLGTKGYGAGRYLLFAEAAAADGTPAGRHDAEIGLR